MKESKKEKKVIELLKKQKYSIEEIARITNISIERVKKIANKIWKLDREKDLALYIVVKQKLKTDIKINIKEKYGFYK